MKYFYTIPLIIFIKLLATSQTLSGLIVYKAETVLDTIKNNSTINEGTLFFDVNSKKSIYVSNRVVKPEQEKHIYERKEDGSTVIKKTSKSGDKVGRVTYKNFEDRVLVTRDGFNGKSFIIKEDYPKINWSILDSTKLIKGLTCQKAEGDFHGRHYTAWFTNKIQTPDGPWKLCGLPGLIIEAYDAKKHFRFEAQSIDYPQQNNEVLEAPTDGEAITLVQFYKLKVQAIEDTDKKIKVILSQEGSNNSFGKLSYNLIERDIGY